MKKKLVFLFDVDNTLLDNDSVTADDLKRRLERELGHERQERYWAIFEELRDELGYADYLGAVSTVFVRQGHYALDEKAVSSYPPADFTIERIGDLLKAPFIGPAG